MEGATEFYLRGLPIIDADTETDIILIQMAGRYLRRPWSRPEANYVGVCLCVMRRGDSIKKPLAAAMFTGGRPETVLAAAAARDILTKAGIAVFYGGGISGAGNQQNTNCQTLISKSEIRNKFQISRNKEAE